MLAINFLFLTYVVSTVSEGTTKFLINRLCTSKTKKCDMRTRNDFYCFGSISCYIFPEKFGMM